MLFNLVLPSTDMLKYFMHWSCVLLFVCASVRARSCVVVVSYQNCVFAMLFLFA